MRATILASFLLTLLPGCSLVRYGIFTNTLEENVTLEVRQLTSSERFEGPERYQLGAGQTKRAVCLIAEVTAMDSSGQVLFRQVLPGFRPEGDKFQEPGAREIYYLVTRDGAYPIPIGWQKNWREHQKEIVADFDVKAARQRLVKDGILKE